MREVYEKYISGDPISDEELDKGIEFFQKLSDDLSMLGPVFLLTAKESYRVLYSLEGFKRAREEGL